MSDWQVGDLAVCVNAKAWIPGGLAPALLREGATYKVTGVTKPARWRGGHYGAGLILDGAPAPRNHRANWPEARFRKIRPDEHEACEPEFVTLLKRVKAPAIEAQRATTENTGVVGDESAAPKAGARK